MTQMKEIGKLKDIGTETSNMEVVRYVIENLAAYGHKSIPAITEIVNYQANIDIRSYGLETIEKIKHR